MRSQDVTDHLLAQCKQNPETSLKRCVFRERRPPKRQWPVDIVIIFFVSLVIFSIAFVVMAFGMEVSLIPCDGGTCAIVNAKPEDQADYVLVEVFFEQTATIEKKEVKLLLHHQVTVPMVAGAHVASDPMGVDMKKIVRLKYTTLKRGEVKEQKITGGNP